MTKTIEFTRKTKFTGRNGYFNASGIELMKISDNKIMITPITGRGEPGRCDIEIPIENIRDLIYELGDLIQQKYRVRDPESGSETINGYLAWNGEICDYSRGQAIKKARVFKGKIEKVTN
jgi:hypothetical protein